MSFEIYKGTPDDLGEIIDFGNYVFSHAGDLTDFPSLLPKLYGPNADTSACHYLAKENGRIKGMVGSFPMVLSAAGEKLTVGGIGTVCVHPYSRGGGVMKALMNEALEDMKRQKIDLAVLGGLRQRYQYYGFEQCGQALFFTFNSSNIRHSLAGRGLGCVFQPIESGYLEDACRLHNLQQIHVERESGDFLDILKSWQSTPLAFLKDGVFAGYLVVSKKGDSVSELVLKDDALALDLLAAYYRDYAPETLTVRMQPFERGVNRLFSEICELSTIKKSYSYRIFNFEKVLNAMLKFKAHSAPLPDGRAVMEIEGCCKLLFQVTGGAVSVAETKEIAEISLSYLEAMNAVFSPVSFFCADDRLPVFLKQLFPLPLYLPKCDMV